MSAALSVLHPRHGVTPSYTFVGPTDTCAYCGMPAETDDHTVPQWLVNGNVEIIKRYRFACVRACSDCNCRAGGKVDKTFLHRRKRIATSIRRKAAKVLKTAYYDPEEVAEFGRGLRSLIEESMEAGMIVRRRLRMLESIEIPEGIPNELWISRRHDEDDD